MTQFILLEKHGPVTVLTLNRPECLNAWHAPMRAEIVQAIRECGADDGVRALVLTGAGDRAFCAGQDLNEAQNFDGVRAQQWIGEWETFYDAMRGFTKPIVVALNGTAAGSAFQVALLGDIRIAHPGVRMGQPEINSGIASVTGPWIMREMLGLSRTVELTLTGRLMDAQECHAIGLVHRLVEQAQVLPAALALAQELAGKPPVAMRLDKERFREVTEAGFRETIAAAGRIHHASYESGEPARMMQAFFAERARRHGQA